MKKLLTVLLSGALAAGSLLSFAACSEGADPNADRQGDKFSSPDTTLTVSANKTEREISDELFGVFLEDINYAGYALDDDLVANGSFTYRDPVDRWTAEGISLQVEEEEGGLHENNPSYAVLDIYSLGATLENAGYSVIPMAVTEGAEYTFSAFVRAEDYAGTFTAALMAGEEVLDEATFTVLEGAETDWVKYTAPLTASKTADEDVTLRITFSDAGYLALDSVSLVTSEATGGIKNYLFEAIDALSPAFIRFPGGCVVEGKRSGDAVYDWKNSIGVDGEDELAPFTYQEVDETGTAREVTTYGEAATRKPNTDIWQNNANVDYEMNYGVGFYEYFLLCENVGASAVPVLNVGLSCMIQDGGGWELPGRYGNGIDDFIDEALDLVAFAKGDPNSSDANEAKWAQARVNMGHPEPFEMNYLGIGNEQWDSRYYGIYLEFVNAFKEARESNPDLYGGVQLIVGNGAAFTDCENAKTGAVGLAHAQASRYVMAGYFDKISDFGVHDHHYYMSPEDFYSNTDLYDSYTREDATRYDVFVGEYSANTNTSINTWYTALSEAAYMTGLERNGDVVKLAAYAPMFGNDDRGVNQWAADMMYYTNTDVGFTPNYYVQQLFMNNQGDAVLENEFSSFENTMFYGSSEGLALYKSVTVDEETGDIIVKLVNGSGSAFDVNIAVKGASTAGLAYVTTLQCDDTAAANTLAEEKVSPESYTLGIASTFGYTAEAYSVSIIRITTK